MANEPGNLPKQGASDKELALWMLARMRDSEEFLGVIRAARTAGQRDALDAPEYIDLHQKRLAPLYQGETEELVEAPATLAAMMEALAKRDLLAGREDLIEKAIAAYIATHPDGDTGLPKEWQSTFDAAEAEVEGLTQGAFKPGFVAELATAARSEIGRRAGLDKGRGAKR